MSVSHEITIEYPFANFTVQWRGIPLPRLMRLLLPLLLELNNWMIKWVRNNITKALGDEVDLPLDFGVVIEECQR